jgi:hypothetical protein
VSHELVVLENSILRICIHVGKKINGMVVSLHDYMRQLPLFPFVQDFGCVRSENGGRQFSKRELRVRGRRRRNGQQRIGEGSHRPLALIDHFAAEMSFVDTTPEAVQPEEPPSGSPRNLPLRYSDSTIDVAGDSSQLPTETADEPTFVQCLPSLVLRSTVVGRMFDASSIQQSFYVDSVFKETHNSSYSIYTYMHIKLL